MNNEERRRFIKELEIVYAYLKNSIHFKPDRNLNSIFAIKDLSPEYVQSIFMRYSKAFAEGQQSLDEHNKLK